MMRRKEYTIGKRESLQYIVLKTVKIYVEKKETGLLSYTIENKLKMA